MIWRNAMETPSTAHAWHGPMGCPKVNGSQSGSCLIWYGSLNKFGAWSGSFIRRTTKRGLDRWLTMTWRNSMETPSTANARHGPKGCPKVNGNLLRSCLIYSVSLSSARHGEGQPETSCMEVDNQNQAHTPS